MLLRVQITFTLFDDSVLFRGPMVVLMDVFDNGGVVYMILVARDVSTRDGLAAVATRSACASRA